MELCNDQTLKDVIQLDRIENVATRYKIFMQILDGLEYIHSQGIIHRDLKPSNIYFLYNQVKIGDFGLSCVASSTASFCTLDMEECDDRVDDDLLDPIVLNLDNQDAIRMIQESNEHQAMQQLTVLEEAADEHTSGLGTPNYIAPEMLVHKGRYNNKVDIYSVGIIFFEMAYPFGTLSERHKLITNIRKRDVEFPADISKYLKDRECFLLRRMLDHDPKKRPDATQLKKACRQLLAEMQIGEQAQPEPESLNESVDSTILSKFDQNEQIICNIVSKPNSNSFAFLMEKLFNRPVSLTEFISYDCNVETNESRSFYRRNLSFNLVQSLYWLWASSFGASRLPVSTLSLKNIMFSTDEKSLRSVQLLDQQGNILTLPSELRARLARVASFNHNILFLHRSDIEKMYIQLAPVDENTLVHPHEVHAASLDFVWPKKFTTSSTLLCIEHLVFSYKFICSFMPKYTGKDDQLSEDIDVFHGRFPITFHLSDLTIVSNVCSLLKIHQTGYFAIVHAMVSHKDILMNIQREHDLYLDQLEECLDDNDQMMVNEQFANTLNDYRSELNKIILDELNDQCLTDFDMVGSLSRSMGSHKSLSTVEQQRINKNAANIFSQLFTVIGRDPLELAKQINVILSADNELHAHKVSDFMIRSINPNIRKLVIVHKATLDMVKSTEPCHLPIRFKFALTCLSKETKFYNNLTWIVTTRRIDADLQKADHRSHYLVLGVGGRYDYMINTYYYLSKSTTSKPDDFSTEHRNDPLTSAAEFYSSKYSQGISFNVERLASLFQLWHERTVSIVTQDLDSASLRSSAINSLSMVNPGEQFTGPSIQSSLWNQVATFDMLVCFNQVSLQTYGLVDRLRQQGLRVAVLPECLTLQHHLKLVRFCQF